LTFINLILKPIRLLSSVRNRKNVSEQELDLLEKQKHAFLFQMNYQNSNIDMSADVFNPNGSYTDRFLFHVSLQYEIWSRIVNPQTKSQIYPFYNFAFCRQALNYLYAHGVVGKNYTLKLLSQELLVEYAVLHGITLSFVDQRTTTNRGRESVKQVLVTLGAAATRGFKNLKGGQSLSSYASYQKATPFNDALSKKIFM